MPRKIPTFRPGPLSAHVARRAYESSRPRQADKNFYSSARWVKLRAAFLAEHPLCADCQRQGRLTPAVHVHHVKERKTYPDLALDWDNLESACVPCHNAKRSLL